MIVPYLCIAEWTITICTSPESLTHARSNGVTGYWVYLSLRPVLIPCFYCPRLETYCKTGNFCVRFIFTNFVTVIKRHMSTFVYNKKKANF